MPANASTNRPKVSCPCGTAQRNGRCIPCGVGVVGMIPPRKS